MKSSSIMAFSQIGGSVCQQFILWKFGAYSTATTGVPCITIINDDSKPNTQALFAWGAGWSTYLCTV